jgi:endonuclease-8
MPEGPEIHREADAIRNAVGQSECRYVYFHHDHLKPYEKTLTGRAIQNVSAKGKAILIHFEDDLTMFSHNQLYGKWFIKHAGEYPKTNRELRVELRTDQKSALLYSASDIEVLKPDELKEQPYLKNLGPDILDDLDAEAVYKRAVSDKFNGRSFAALLLDQHFLSGVGNYLRSEILFDAGVDPSARPKDLNESELDAFSKSVIQISQRAYITGGITADDETVRKAKKSGEKRKHYRHYVFSRDGKPCRDCGTEVQKVQKSGRRLYLCESCQL